MKVISCPSTPLVDPVWENISPDRIVSGSPRSTYHLLYTSISGEFYSGVYECTAGAWKIAYTEDEFCTLLSGHVRLTPENGDPVDFHAPASFLIPAGYKGAWEAVTPVRKLFAIYEKTK
jgi:uncharacterized cupin superfamily protein